MNLAVANLLVNVVMVVVLIAVWVEGRSLLRRKDEVVDRIDLTAVAAEGEARRARHAIKNLDAALRLTLRAAGFDVPDPQVEEDVAV